MPKAISNGKARFVAIPAGRFYSPTVAAAASRMAKSGGQAILDYGVKYVKKAWQDRGRNVLSSARKVSRSIPGKFSVKRKRTGGARNSRSAGKISKGRKNYTPEDMFSQKGILICREGSGIITTTAAEKAQSILIGHANYTTRQLKSDVSHALTKWCAGLMDCYILQFADLIPLQATESYALNFWYKTSVGGSEIPVVFTVNAGDPWSVLATFFYNTLTLANNQSELFWLRLQCVRRIAGVDRECKFNVDMTRMRVQLYSKSSLKVQNRTINSAGNDEVDDVDNVPVYGKMYSGNGNFIMHQDVAIGPNGTSTLLPAVCTAKFAAGSAMCEPQPLSFIKKANKIAKIKLDPGDIKTNIIVSSHSFNLNVLSKMYSRSGADVAASFDGFNVGKFSFIHVEKMIQAVATTDVNAMNIAYEVDTKSGCIITAPKIRQTNILTYIQNQ